jgi:hypothetical protein
VRDPWPQAYLPADDEYEFPLLTSIIYLLRCRKKSAYAPWKCEEERHAYEVCQYKEYVRRREMKKDGVM